MKSHPFGARTSRTAGFDPARGSRRMVTPGSLISTVRLVTAALISALLAAGCKGETTASQPKGQAVPPPAVVVAEVIRKNVPVYGEYVAQTVASGVASYLEVLDADTKLFSSELDLAKARREELLAGVQLYRALGGGWQDVKLPAEPPTASVESPPPSARD